MPEFSHDSEIISNSAYMFCIMKLLLEPTPWAIGVAHALQTIAHRLGSHNNNISAWMTNTKAAQTFQHLRARSLALSSKLKPWN